MNIDCQVSAGEGVVADPWEDVEVPAGVVGRVGRRVEVDLVGLVAVDAAVWTEGEAASVEDEAWTAAGEVDQTGAGEHPAHNSKYADSLLYLPFKATVFHGSCFVIFQNLKRNQSIQLYFFVDTILVFN